MRYLAYGKKVLCKNFKIPCAYSRGGVKEEEGVNNKRIVIFSTEESRYFAELIAKKLNMPTVGDIERLTFGGGERWLRIGIEKRDDLMGKTVIFVGSTHTDEDITELYRVGSAAAMYGARRRIFVIPFLGYSTMERAKMPGEVVTAKTLIRQLSGIPNSGMGNVFLLLDLHVSGLVHYFEGDCQRYELQSRKLLVEAIKKLGFDNFMFGSADLGRPEMIAYFARAFNTHMALIDKGREFEKTEVLAVIGDVRKKHVIIYDDMTRSAGTIVDGANAYLENGARSVSAVLSHFALNNESILEKLLESPLKHIITTNSHPRIKMLNTEHAERITVVDVSGEFTKSIEKIIK